jgi:hypothetical protein
LLINWGKLRAGNIARIEGTDYRCERYWLDPNGVKEYWYMLADSEWTYRCCKGPFNSPQERDKDIINEVGRRNESKKGNK